MSSESDIRPGYEVITPRKLLGKGACNRCGCVFRYDPDLCKRVVGGSGNVEIPGVACPYKDCDGYHRTGEPY